MALTVQETLFESFEILSPRSLVKVAIPHFLGGNELTKFNSIVSLRLEMESSPYVYYSIGYLNL
jgi:hypothetical protein